MWFTALCDEYCLLKDDLGALGHTQAGILKLPFTPVLFECYYSCEKTSETSESAEVFVYMNLSTYTCVFIAIMYVPDIFVFAINQAAYMILT